MDNSDLISKESLKYKYRDAKYGYFMVIPALLAIMLFQGVPIVMALIRVFQDYETKMFVGYRNFFFILQQEVFIKSFLHVFIMVVIILPITLILAFLFAQVLKNMQNGFGSVTKIIIYLPSLFSGILVSIMFLLIFNFGGGLITYFRIQADKEPISFQSEMPWPYVLIILISIWGGIGYNTLIMYAGTIGIPKDYYEAAKLDGANGWVRLTRITLPCLKNYFILQTISITTGTIQMFELPMMIGGGLETMTPIWYIYNLFLDFTVDFNITTAGALLTAILIGGINAITFKILKSEKSMDD